MDMNIFASAGVSTGAIVILGALWKIWNNIRGHRLISDCCGRFYEVGVDVRDMPHTPEDKSRNQSLLSVQVEQSSESPPVTYQEPSRHLPDLKTSKSIRIRLPPQSEEEENALVSVAPTTSDTKQSEPVKVSNPETSEPPLLKG
jgi:hypothetical protein